MILRTRELNVETWVRRTLFTVGWAVMIGLVLIQNSAAALNIQLWDTHTTLSDSPILADRAGWKAVPSDLLSLEADPSKASSDPGYYGRAYVFEGDAVVENRSLAAVFSYARGTVAL